MHSISTLLAWGKATLSDKMSASEAAFEAAYLLCEYLKVEKSYLYTWPQKAIDSRVIERYQTAVEKRKKGMPIAYILGYKEFWSMSFKVSDATLIPRPETEVLVEALLEAFPAHSLTVLELGTGTGAVACALAKTRPLWEILATDVSASALAIASENIKYHQLPNVTLLQSDWFEKISTNLFDVIVSNPPYVEENSPHLNRDTQFEPALALFSGPEGLDAITHIIQQAKKYLKPNGMLCFEHGFEQAKLLQALFEKNGYNNIKTIKDYSGLDRVTMAFSPLI